MMNALDRDEEFGDGYSNDYQRALAVSRMRREPSNGLAQAQAFAASGLYAVCEEVTVYCPITDGIMGSDISCLGAYGRVEAALIRAEDAAKADSDARVFIVYPPGKEPKAEPAPSPEWPDDVPF